MKPSLHALKKQKGLTTPTKKTVVSLAVVDQEIKKKYPANFVCILPRQFSFPTCTFQKLYGDNSRDMAKKLLTKALERENDSEVKSEIIKRLKCLNGKEPNGLLTLAKP